MESFLVYLLSKQSRSCKIVKTFVEGTIENVAAEQKKNILVIPIAFVTDHIETQCEINIEIRELAYQ